MVKKNFNCIKICGLAFILIFSCKESDKTKIDSNNTQNPLSELNTAINKNPYSDSLFYQRAKINYDLGNVDSVYSDLNKAIYFNKNKREYYFFLADTYLENAQSLEAKKVLENALNIFPEDKQVQLKYVKLLIILKQYPLATASLNDVLIKDPQNAEAFYLGGHISYEMGDTAAAINAYQKTVDLNPDFREGWILLGDVMRERKNKLSLQYYDNALKLDSNDVETLHNKAYALQQFDQKEKAFELYQSICRKFKDYEPAFYNLGLMYMEKDSVDKAIEHLTISIELNPMEASSYYQRGLCFEKIGKRVEAKSDLTRATTLEPDWKEAKQALSRILK